MAKKEKRERKWLLVQSRIDIRAGRELQELAKEDGLPTSAYVRRLVLHHLAEVKRLTSSGPAAQGESA